MVELDWGGNNPNRSQQPNEGGDEIFTPNSLAMAASMEMPTTKAECSWHVFIQVLNKSDWKVLESLKRLRLILVVGYTVAMIIILNGDSYNDVGFPEDAAVLCTVHGWGSVLMLVLMLVFSVWYACVVLSTVPEDRVPQQHWLLLQVGFCVLLYVPAVLQLLLHLPGGQSYCDDAANEDGVYSPTTMRVLCCMCVFAMLSH